MSRIYALASMKGGVGKTTIAGNLGVGLGQLGKETLLADTDLAMGGLTQLLNVSEPEGTRHPAEDHGIYSKRERGRRAYETIMTMLATWKQQKLDPYEEMLKAVRN